MAPLTVIIPSKTASNLAVSVRAVRGHEPDARIIVIDDAVDPGFLFESILDGPNIWLAKGDKPFIFARNINRGIRLAGEDSDVVLLNDDAILQTPGGFSIMQAAAELSPQVGIIGAVTDLTGQRLQMRKRDVELEQNARACPILGLRAVGHIAFVCVLIPARTRKMLREHTEQLANVLTGGFLDERYTGYGSDDLDYCMQCERITLCVCVHDACYVDHGSLTSSYRGLPTAAGNIWPNHRILRAKWSMPPNPADPEYSRLMAARG